MRARKLMTAMIATLVATSLPLSAAHGSVRHASPRQVVAPVGMAAPYLYLGWGHPPSPVKVMSATGVRDFTLAFVLSSGGCTPAWDGERPLEGGKDAAAIRAIRHAGGDVVASFGGWSGLKLGEDCPDAATLATAYEQVIDAYHLAGIDIDIEHTEMASAAVRQRVVDALVQVHADRPTVALYMTIGTTTDGPDARGLDLIARAAAAGLTMDAWNIMPFDFGAPIANMGKVSVRAAEGLKAALMAAYGISAFRAYRTMGITSMNGRTDEADETVRLRDFRTILAYAKHYHLARLSFWSVNRDRPCTAGTSSDACSGIHQQPWVFTKLFARYKG